MTSRQPQVFISYERTDGDVAQQVRADLVAAGAKTWMDQYDNPAGANWPDEIDKGLANSDIIVGILSPDAVASRNVMNEWDWALANGRRVVLLQVAACAVPHRYVEISLINALELGQSQALATLVHSLGHTVTSAAPVRASAETAGTSASEPRAPRVIPAPLTPLIGRQEEVAALLALIRDAGLRLITLLGPGGVGKTRLAVQVANDLSSQTPDGSWFVALAPLQEPALVFAVIAETLGLRDDAAQPLSATVAAYLALRRALLVLDNFEHLTAAAAEVALLLQRCPHLVIIVTSRAPLRVAGEQEVQVAPLAVPSLQPGLPTDALGAVPSVALFVQRVRAVRPNFSITPDNAQAIGGICARLEGLPLALELAAIRLKTLSPADLLARLSDRFSLLTGGPRDAPTRHRTLRNTISWSYELLSAEEQVFLRRLSVFAGGFSLDAATAVANPHDELDLDTTDALTTLLEQSLVQTAVDAGGAVRFGMLETIREYAAEQLADMDDADATCLRHANWCLEVAQQGAPAMPMDLPQDLDRQWLARLDAEHANLRAALRWMESNGRRQLAVALVAVLGQYWSLRGHAREGRAWIERLVAHDDAIDDAPHAAAWYWAGILADATGDATHSAACYERSLAIWSDLGDLGGVAMSLGQLGFNAELRGDERLAWQRYEQYLDAARQANDPDLIAHALLSLGDTAFRQGDLTRSWELSTEALASYRQTGNQVGLAATASNLAQVALARGDLNQATSYYAEALEQGVTSEERFAVPDILAGIAGVAVARGDATQAARLLGAVDVLLARADHAWLPHHGQHARTRAAAVAALTEAAYARAFADGTALDRAAAIAEARTVLAGPIPDEPLSPDAKHGYHLTARERDVLRLVAEGLTDAQVAAQLYLSRRTVSSHLTAIYSKFGVTSRTAATRVALERDLL